MLERPLVAPLILLSQPTTVPPASLSTRTPYSPPGPRSPEFPATLLPRPQPGASTWTWKPSRGLRLPRFPWTVQALPLTSTQESAPVMFRPVKVLPLTVPELVPSLRSTLSAVAPGADPVPEDPFR